MKTHFIFYDLETTSLEIKNARILQISCCFLDTNETFDKYIDPGDIEIKNSEIHHITKEVIKKNNGYDCKLTLEELEKWCYSFCKNDEIIWIAHNNHDYDKLVLQMEYDRNKKNT